jgi:hypothetical protein
MAAIVDVRGPIPAQRTMYIKQFNRLRWFGAILCNLAVVLLYRVLPDWTNPLLKPCHDDSDTYMGMTESLN